MQMPEPPGGAMVASASAKSRSAHLLPLPDFLFTRRLLRDLVTLRQHSRVNCVPEHVCLAEIVVLVGAGQMAPPTCTRISARLKRVQGHGSPANGGYKACYKAPTTSIVVRFLGSHH